MIVRFRVPIPDGMDREQAMEQLLGKPIAVYDLAGKITYVAPTIMDGSTIADGFITCEAEVDGPLAEAIGEGALREVSMDGPE